jgi:hypothetical protein
VPETDHPGKEAAFSARSYPGDSLFHGVDENNMCNQGEMVELSRDM